MSRLANRLGDLRAQGRTALIPYVTAGDPAPDATIGFMHALVEAGADVLEVGVPFSDPMARSFKAPASAHWRPARACRACSIW
jgi:tryptophan synthase alpha chain